MVIMGHEDSIGLRSALRNGDASDSEKDAGNLKLVLFDIDGTLSTGGTFTRHLAAAIEEKLKLGITPDSLEERIKVGRTASQEITLIAREAGVSDEARSGVVDAILASATTSMERELSKSPLKALDGVAEFLSSLAAREDVVLGVVTNNTKESMLIKLRSTGLLDYFSGHGILVCASDGQSKIELVEFAIKKAEDVLQTKIFRKNVFYFGDQVSDIFAGALAGAVSIGVATGRSSFEELGRAGADSVLRSFSDHRAAMATIDRVARRDKSVRIIPL